MKLQSGYFKLLTHIICAILLHCPPPPKKKVVATPSTPPTPKTTSVRPKPTDATLTLTGTCGFYLTLKKQQFTVRVTVNLCSVSLLFSLATPPARPTSETKTSVQPEPSDILTTPTAPSLQTGTFFIFFILGSSIQDTSVSTAAAHFCLNTFSTVVHRLEFYAACKLPLKNLIQFSTNVVRNMKRSVRKTGDEVVLFSFHVAFIMRGGNSVSQIFDYPEMTPRFLRQALYL